MVHVAAMTGIDLEGRVAVVTGGGRGIGAAIVRALAGAGAHVAVSGRTEAALEEVVEEVRRAGGRAFAVRCDVTRPDDVAQLCSVVRKEAGPASIVVNNAGVARSAKLSRTDQAMWDEMLAVNLTGAYRVTRAFLDDVVAAGKRGRIIHIASVAAKVGFHYTTAYCASKHGLLGFTRALALELAALGPTVNCVCPGWVDTEMTGETILRIQGTTGRSAVDARRELEKLSPQNRLMTAAEVAEVTLFLASDATRGVTGQGWNVDGGEVMS
jgi:NAD(P)-dependent dehydrogenase (short-subunit alcohol dehydrogenase family)